jgi:hypothetical protein
MYIDTPTGIYTKHISVKDYFAQLQEHKKKVISYVVEKKPNWVIIDCVLGHTLMTTINEYIEFMAYYHNNNIGIIVR